MPTTTAVHENVVSSDQIAETSNTPEETSGAVAESSSQEFEATSQNIDGSSVLSENNETSSEDVHVEATSSSLETSRSDEEMFSSTIDATSISTWEPILSEELSSPATEISSTHAETSSPIEESRVSDESPEIDPFTTTLAISSTPVAPGSVTVDAFSIHAETSSSIEEGKTSDESPDIEPFTTSLAASCTSVAPDSGTVDVFSAHGETSSSIEENNFTDANTDDEPSNSLTPEPFSTILAVSSTLVASGSGTVDVFIAHVETSSSIEESTATDETTNIESLDSGGPEPFPTTLAISSTPVAPDSGIVDVVSVHVETSSAIKEVTFTDETTDVESTPHGGTEPSFIVTVTTSTISIIADSGTADGSSSSADGQLSQSVLPSEAFVAATSRADISTTSSTSAEPETSFVAVTSSAEVSTSSSTSTQPETSFIAATSSADISTTSSTSVEPETSTTLMTPIVDLVDEIIDTLEQHPVSGTFFCPV